MPKGVTVSHQSLLQLLASMKSLYPVDNRDIWSLFHCFAFDVSLWELWGAFYSGCKLLLIPEVARKDLRLFYEMIAAHKVTVLSQTPRVFELLIDCDAHSSLNVSSLHWIFLAGDMVQVTSLQAWWKHHEQDSAEAPLANGKNASAAQSGSDGGRRLYGRGAPAHCRSLCMPQLTTVRCAGC